MAVRLDWRGKEVQKRTRLRAAKVMLQVGFSIVELCQRQLYSGHGLITGTLRRSYHVGKPDYFPGKAEEAAAGGKLAIRVHQVKPEDIVKDLKLMVGSWLNYARAVDQGKGSFQGYGQLFNALDGTKRRVPFLIKKVAKDSEAGI